MTRKNLINLIYKKSDSIAIDLGFELVDVEYKKEFGSNFLRIYIDKPGGIHLEDCQVFSEKISQYLDTEDPISETYYLEVSSPGLDRPLKTDKDLKRNIGKEIEINLYKAIDNKKKYDGELLDFNESEIIISDNGNNKLFIKREFISLIKLKVNF